MSKIHPSVIQRGCTIADSVEIREYCTLHESELSDKVIVMERVSLKRCAVGEGSEINTGSYLENVEVGPQTQIGPNCSASGMWHSFDEMKVNKEDVTSRITIGANCLLGAGAIFTPGVKIGTGSVIGAGAIVTKDIPDHHIYWGVPPNHTLLSISDYLKRKKTAT